MFSNLFQHKIRENTVCPSRDWRTLSLHPVQFSTLMSHLLVRYEHLYMIATSDAPSKSELQNEIRFLQAEGISAAKLAHLMRKVSRN